jgi:hypothetical protein
MKKGKEPQRTMAQEDRRVRAAAYRMPPTSQKQPEAAAEGAGITRGKYNLLQKPTLNESAFTLPANDMTIPLTPWTISLVLLRLELCWASAQTCALMFRSKSCFKEA